MGKQNWPYIDNSWNRVMSIWGSLGQPPYFCVFKFSLINRIGKSMFEFYKRVEIKTLSLTDQS